MNDRVGWVDGPCVSPSGDHDDDVFNARADLVDPMVSQYARAFGVSKVDAVAWVWGWAVGDA